MCNCSNHDETCLDAEKEGLKIGRRAALASLGLTAVGGGFLASTLGSTSKSHAADNTSGDRVITLGVAAGPLISKAATGISTALVVNGSTYVVDCGLGSSRQYVLAGLDPSTLRNIFITHLHTDHIADYFTFLNDLRMHIAILDVPGVIDDPNKVPFSVYGPGSAGGLTPTPIKPKVIVEPQDPTPGLKQLTEAINKGFAYTINVFEVSLETVPPLEHVKINEIAIPPQLKATYLNQTPDCEPFFVMKDENVTVTATLVHHYNVFPAFAYRFDTVNGNSITFSGDTIYSPNLVKLAKNSDILIHESIYELKNYYMQQSHSTPETAGRVARESGSKHLILSHYQPLDFPDEKWLTKIRTEFKGKASVGKDLTTYTFD